MAKFKNLVLTELGNTTEHYRSLKVNVTRMEPENDSFGAEFSFQTENYSYNGFCHLTTFMGKNYIKVAFDTDETGQEVTNEGKPFKVVATVIEAVRRAHEIATENGVRVDGFEFDAISKGSPDPGVTQREKLYKTFIRNQYPSAEFERTVTQNIRVTI